MFRRTTESPPSEVQFPTGLAALGIARNDLGQYVKANDPDSFIDYKAFQDDATNSQLAQAVKDAIQGDVLKELEDLDMLPCYLHQDDKKAYTDPVKPPKKSSVRILASDMQRLSSKKQIFIIIGDSSQELGIWSWKTTKTEGGINKGTAVGVVKSLRSMTANVDLRGQESKQPGIIILNPGELLWSNKERRCFSHAAWRNRPRPNAFMDTYAITAHNKVPGHEQPLDHVTTFLHVHLRSLVPKKARLYITAIGDGASTLLSHLNHKLAKYPNPIIYKQLTAIALLESSHDFEAVETPRLQHFLRKHARAWVASQEPKGFLLKHAETFPSQPIDVQRPLGRRHQDPVIRNSAITGIRTDPRITPAQPSDLETYMRIYREERYFEVERELAEEGPAVPDFPVATDRPEFDREFYFPSAAGADRPPIDPPAHVPRVRHRRTREVFNPMLPAPLTRRLEDDRREKAEDDDPFGIGTTDAANAIQSTDLADPTDPIDLNDATDPIDANDVTDPTDADDATDDPFKPYAYMQDPVNASTYSAGVEDIAEMIFPAVVDDVVGFFKCKMK